MEHDYGFAPNPFHGICTLATCKPRIREHAAIGDVIVGTGCAKRRRRGFVVYFMRVDEIISFDDYWNDPRFSCKRPFLRGSKMQAFGDNIYHTHVRTHRWVQENSYHSLTGGKSNPLNVQTDTDSIKVLIGAKFAYWGGAGPKIPDQFRDYQGVDICAKRGHRVNFPQPLVTAFVGWLRSRKGRGYLAPPLDWVRCE